MAVVNREKRALGPIQLIFFILRSHHVEDNANPVLVVVPHVSLVSVRCVGVNYAVFLVTVLRLIYLRNLT